MNNQENQALYWQGRSDAFQDAVAFVRTALGAPKLPALAGPQDTHHLFADHPVWGCDECERKFEALLLGRPAEPKKEKR